MKSIFRLSVLLISLTISSTSFATFVIEYNLIGTRSHKVSSFTQGLEIHGNDFYESSGLYEQSFLARYPILEPTSTWAKISAPYSERIPLASRYFAEGLTLLNDKLYLLTWKEKTLHTFALNPLRQMQSFRYDGEGWGLTNDGSSLIRSDGSATLYFHNPSDFTLLKKIAVTQDGAPCDRLNELEYHDGFIYANRWYTNVIVKIDPATGKVVGTIDLSDIAKLHSSDNPDDVLNGIAWDEKRNGFWITGKRWRTMYLIQLVPHE